MNDFLKVRLNDVQHAEEDLLNTLQENRRLFARFVGAKPTEIALASGASLALNQVSQLIPFKKKDNVIVCEKDYVSCVLVWLKLRKKGLEVRFASNKNGTVTASEIEKIADENTMAICVSNPNWYNGYLHDLKHLGEIVHRNGGYLVVDGIQGCGAMAVDCKGDGVDFYVAASHKKLLGPFSVGYLYIRNDLIEELEPAFVYLGIQPEGLNRRNIYDAFDAYELKTRRDIKRHDMYPAPEVHVAGAKASMNFLLDMGLKNIEAHVRKLNDHLVGRLQELGVEFQSPLDPKLWFGNLNFKVKNHRVWEKKMMQRGILISVRLSGVRVSPHCYNTIDDIDEFADAAKALLR